MCKLYILTNRRKLISSTLSFLFHIISAPDDVFFISPMPTMSSLVSCFKEWLAKKMVPFLTLMHSLVETITLYCRGQALDMI